MPSCLPSLDEVLYPAAGAGEQDLQITSRGEEKEALGCPESRLLRGIGGKSWDLAGIPAGVQDASDRLLLSLVSLRISRVKT
jgi:hypothetical protein